MQNDDFMDDGFWYFTIMILAGLLMMLCIAFATITWPLAYAVTFLSTGGDHG